MSQHHDHTLGDDILNDSHETSHTPKRARKIQRKHVHIGLIVFVSIVVVVGGAFGTAAVVAKEYETRLLPGVEIAGISVEGLTKTQAQELIQEKASELLDNGITLALEDENELLIPAVITPLDSAGEDILFFDIDVDATVDQAFEYGHTGNNASRWFAIALSAFTTHPHPVETEVQQEALASYLNTNLEEFETKPVNALLAVEDGKTLNITPEKNGSEYNRENIINVVQERVSTLSTDPIQVDLEETIPKVTKAIIADNETAILALLKNAPATLTYDGKEWSFDADTIGTWLTYTESGITIDPEAMHETVSKKATGIEVEPVEGRWKVITSADNKPTNLEEISAPVVGKKFDTKEAATELLAALKKTSEPRVELSLTEYQPQFRPVATSGDELPIKELLGTGHSDMTGSPVNRQGNIKRGAELLNGLIIPTDAEFSLLKALGPFTLENGYKAELVIKGNETIPEIGGGLCQVGTTTFRATMMSGLPVTARANHSYAVSYYSDDRNKLPGTDATIYDPAPDYKFKNDTGNPILIQTRIDGNHLYFDFWGTSDGRKGEFSAPEITGWIQPPPTKLVETDTLAPGVKKCTETAHPGTTASFTYSVTKKDGTKDERVFTSKYKPWQAVCLVGKAAPAPTPKPEVKKPAPKTNTNKNTNTNSNTNSTTNASSTTNSSAE